MNCVTIHHVKIIQIDLTDEDGGIVSFEINMKEYKAFFWGEKFTIGEEVSVELSHLNYPLDWEIIFNENTNQNIHLEKTSNDAEYIGYGIIKSINPIMVSFGDISLDVGSWTNDEKVIGQYIYWKIDRLDIRRTEKNS